MTRLLRIAVAMQPVADDTGAPSWKAALPMGVLFEKSLDPQEIEEAKSALEERYGELVSALRALRPLLKSNVVHNWELGDLVITFENETADTLLFADRLGDNLARDIHYSKRMIDLCKSFRRKIPDVQQIDPQISFSEYHRSRFAPLRRTAPQTG